MDIQFKVPVADPLDLLDVMSDLFKHASNLAILSFNQGDFVPGIVGFANQIDFGGRGFDSPAGVRANEKACAQFVQPLGAWLAGYLYHVGLMHVGRCLHQMIGKVAVVGQQEQTFTGVVEAADRIDSCSYAVKQVHYGRAAFGIVECGDVALGLVHQQINVPFGPVEKLPVNAYMIAFGISLAAKFDDDLAIH
jgi:hypothetical protein